MTNKPATFLNLNTPGETRNRIYDIFSFSRALIVDRRAQRRPDWGSELGRDALDRRVVATSIQFLETRRYQLNADPIGTKNLSEFRFLVVSGICHMAPMMTLSDSQLG